jgi:tRNA threonylcarbamoyladenosine biosynthesis protein TsaB
MMRVLALDTSTLQASVAVTDGDALVEREHVVTTHSESLLLLVDECLRAANLRPADLDVIACGAGPGSFTGLRIGLATAKGLCFALDKPLVLISSLAAIAARAPDGSCCAAVDAFKNEVYAARFFVRDGVPTLDGEERVLAPAALADELLAHAPILLAGNAVEKYPALLLAGVRRLDERPGPRAADVARLARARAAVRDFDPLATAAPRYIRPSEAELVKAGRPR